VSLENGILSHTGAKKGKSHTYTFEEREGGRISKRYAYSFIIFLKALQKFKTAIT